jgi:nucleotide-binding universal stress UspA family protein
MFKNILVAIDGSSTSNRGFKQALKLAKEQGATLHVLHVIDETPVITGYDGAGYMTQSVIEQFSEGLRKDGTRILAKAEAAAEKEGQQVRTVLLDAHGTGVAHCILAQARKAKADLIVLGTHGRRGLRRLVMGSDAEAVVREATVPVLLVRAAAPHSAGRHTTAPGGAAVESEPARSASLPVS